MTWPRNLKVGRREGGYVDFCVQTNKNYDGEDDGSKERKPGTKFRGREKWDFPHGGEAAPAASPDLVSSYTP
ncbi:hypothetical protein GALMADRAFT_254133 [Galerina marginata CBS 339.88]|uniref:Uncharacterized protein n=1 Tax=Galerina marginata (strain CBS 339.88) TaxID=685588 RepID=A0A067SMT4_GALM3|nr:hypothetical protein GALMADRAFT_254133 [Galerina marginata CBS 339.88]